MDHTNCQGFNELDKRLIRVEEKQRSTDSTVEEIKADLKDFKKLVMTTLVTSTLGLVGITITLLTLL